MNTEQHARNQASTAMLEKMAAFVDELLQEREERRDLEKSYQARMVKQKVNEDE